MKKENVEPIVFLGGTYISNTVSWRDYVISRLNIGYINPENNVSQDLYACEQHQREEADYCLYVLTPESNNFMAIAEVIQDSNIKPNQTLLCIIRDYNGCYFDDVAWYSMECIQKIAKENGAMVFDTLDEVINFLNH